MNIRVLPGHSVVTDRSYLPGETLELEDKEARQLIRDGIVEAVKEGKEAKETK